VLLLEPADPTLPPKADPPGAGKRGEKEAQISALLKPGKNAVGQTIRFSPQLTAQVTRRAGEIFTLQFNRSGRELTTLIDSLGIAPTPPYIKTVSNLKEYQTIYARHRGSVAAPTAGFHFTKPLLASLKKQGVQFEYVTLHVGLGTFQPVKETLVEHHRMHYESYSVCPATWRRLQTARQEGRRIIAVGTTTCRVLETISSSPALRPGLGPHLLHGTTDIFITPGYHFKMTDALITNFHLPQSTLLMLISAFLSDKFNNSKLGIKLTKEIYREAIGRKYRFYSFGDAMLII
jgi:S-adenosylmethionine:tRNA ribosyltransferase-isomerase